MLRRMSRRCRRTRPQPRCRLCLVEPLENRLALVVVTPFTPRFSTNDTGDIVLVSNTVLRANPAGVNGSQAANAQNGVGSPLDNNSFTMINVDVDDDSTTFNSSRADLNLPAGATVLFAGLYWGANSLSAERTQVRFDTPAPGGYT